MANKDNKNLSQQVNKMYKTTEESVEEERVLSIEEAKKLHEKNMAQRLEVYANLKNISSDSGEPYFSMDYLKKVLNIDNNKKP